MLVVEAAWLLMRAAWVTAPTLTVVSGAWIGVIVYRQVNHMYGTVHTTYRYICEEPDSSITSSPVGSPMGSDEIGGPT